MVSLTRPPYPLPRELWAAAGVRTVVNDGQRIPTHARGDQHAAAIIAGRYDYHRAQREHAAALRLSTRWGATPPTLADMLLARSAPWRQP